MKNFFLLCLILLFAGNVKPKNVICTAEVAAFKSTLSTIGVTNGIVGALNIIDSIKTIERTKKDARYIWGQTRSSRQRLLNDLERLQDLGIEMDDEWSLSLSGHRQLVTGGDLQTGHGVLNGRNRGKRASWNPLKYVLGGFWELLGAVSELDHEEYKEHIKTKLDLFELRDQQMAKSLQRASTEMARGLANVENNIEAVANATELVKQTNRIRADLEVIVTSVELIVAIFIEIKDRADQGLASRNIIPVESMKRMNSAANDKFHEIHPLLTNEKAEYYFGIPITTTGYDFDNQEFSSIVHLPQMRSDDVFQTIKQSSNFLTLISPMWQTQILHSEFQDCISSVYSNTFCMKRVCKVSTKSSSIIHSCLVHGQNTVEIVFNNTANYKSAIEVKCVDGEKRPMKLLPKNEIIQFELPLNCKAFNEHLKIDKVITAKLETELLEKRDIKIASFSMSSIGSNDNQINSRATEEVINDLMTESRNMASLAKGFNITNTYITKHGMIGFGIGIMFIAGVRLFIYLGLRCWSQRSQSKS